MDINFYQIQKRLHSIYLKCGTTERCDSNPHCHVIFDLNVYYMYISCKYDFMELSWMHTMNKIWVNNDPQDGVSTPPSFIYYILLPLGSIPKSSWGSEAEVQTVPANTASCYQLLLSGRGTWKYEGRGMGDPLKWQYVCIMLYIENMPL